MFFSPKILSCSFYSLTYFMNCFSPKYLELFEQKKYMNNYWMVLYTG